MVLMNCPVGVSGYLNSIVLWQTSVFLSFIQVIRFERLRSAAVTSNLRFTECRPLNDGVRQHLIFKTVSTSSDLKRHACRNMKMNETRTIPHVDVEQSNFEITDTIRYIDSSMAPRHWDVGRIILQCSLLLVDVSDYSSWGFFLILKIGNYIIYVYELRVDYLQHRNPIFLSLENSEIHWIQKLEWKCIVEINATLFHRWTNDDVGWSSFFG